ncbi:hypothetical protein [Dethiothermospora halolimnae]|uniref:hypothetical protein n=1 Tax=Dethiothermospora halolimnae TaxID=3114390 RepID=UPI003CCB82C6
MNVAYMTIEGDDIRKLGDILDQSISSYNTNSHIYRDGDTMMIMRECYYMRISSTLMSATILKFIGNNRVEIEQVVSGGKSGALMLSWGSENSEHRFMINNIMEICAENSWKVIKVNPEALRKSLKESMISKFKDKVSDIFN